MQLYKKNIRIYDPMKSKFINEDDINKKFGVKPEKIIDVQALAGDTSDNVPGVPGIGPKTAACVLLFALNIPALPVDTHVGRVSKRLGLANKNLSNDDLHDVLEKMIQPKQIYLFHMSLIQHGRRICHSRKPKCNKCPLLKNCPQIDVTID